MPNGISHRYQLEQSISVLRDDHLHVYHCSQRRYENGKIKANVNLHVLLLRVTKFRFDIRYIYLKNFKMVSIAKGNYFNNLEFQY